MTLGRPSKMNDVATALIVEGLEQGMPIELACERAGINRATYFRWQKRADEARVIYGDDYVPGTDPYVDFCDRVKSARAEFFFRKIGQLNTAQGDKEGGIYWQATCVILERMFAEFFARRQVHEIESGDERRDLSKLSAEELRAILTGK